VVTQGKEGVLLALSESFDLPGFGDVVTVEMSLAP
jgi:hypothetical protein